MCMSLNEQKSIIIQRPLEEAPTEEQARGLSADNSHQDKTSRDNSLSLLFWMFIGRGAGEVRVTSMQL
jgi:hypothetical protein